METFAASEVLEVASRVLALVVALGALLSFVFRRWIGAWIDAQFRTRVEEELGRQKHAFSVEIERERARLATEAQRQKATLDEQKEAHRRMLDRDAMVRTRILASRLQTYEAFDKHFGDVVVDLHSLRVLDQAAPPISPEAREAHRLRTLQKLQEAMRASTDNDFHASVDIKVRVASVYASISNYLVNGARDHDALEEILNMQSLLIAEMRLEVESWVRSDA